MRRTVGALALVGLSLGLFPLAGRPAASPTPTFREVTGYDFGERITEHHQMVRYLEELARVSGRVKVVSQGESWEGRKLLLAVVTSPQNQERLDSIQATARRLSDPRTTSLEEARGLWETTPAVVWIGGSIHGFELSGSEGALKLLEHLATREDAETLEVLGDTVVLIDPMLNPDGRDAFAQANHRKMGRGPNPDPLDWSNDFTSWEALEFRTGHYFFDTNRDWFAHTQRETRARVETIQAWRPQAGVDAHEMGPEVEFYFDPPTEPPNPFFPPFASRWLGRFGEAYARAFDEAGFEYTSGELFNYFYPAYTTSYLSYQGAVGMLYEQGSSRGLALGRADGSVRRLRDALEQQYTAAWTLVRTAARERSGLLREYYEAHREALEEGRKGNLRYLILPEGDPQLLAELAGLLLRNGIEVSRLTQPGSLEGLRDRTGKETSGRSFPAGTLVVEAAQPRYHLLRVLLEPDVPLPEDFLQEARRRVERAENPRFYDITAWSLPLLFNLQAYSSTDGRELPQVRLDSQPDTLEIPRRRAAYAYVLDGRQAASVAALYHLAARGYRASVLPAATRIEGRSLAGGSGVVRTGQNDETVHEAVREVARRYRLELAAVDGGRPEPGYLHLGSAEGFSVKKPEIALLAEDGVQAYSFGWAWYTLTEQYGIPVTVLRTRSLASASLDGFNVLILPQASPPALVRQFGEEGVERVKRWVSDGGTLVTLGDSTDFARRDLGLIHLRSWYEDEEGQKAQAFTVPGAILHVELDAGRWLASGYGEDLPVLATSSRLYLPPEGPPSAQQRVVARFPAEGEIRISGHAWEESLERLPGSVFLYEERVGRGRVIAFSEDPNFRAYCRGVDRLFLNAVLLGPSAP